MTVRPERHNTSGQRTETDPQARPLRGNGPGGAVRPAWLIAASATVAATAINLGLYATGRLVGAALVLDPGVGPANHEIVGIDVAWKTFVPLSLGMVALLLARRRSDRWIVAVVLLGLVIALGTGAVPPFGAHDGLTAVLLAGMHTVPGLALAWTGLRLRRRSADQSAADSASAPAGVAADVAAASRSSR